MRKLLPWPGALAVLLLVTLTAAVFSAAPAPLSREQLLKQYNDGNYSDAFEGYRKLVLDPKSDPNEVGRDLERAVHCLRNLSRENEADDLVDQVVAVHPKNWKALASGAEIYSRGFSHYGYIVAGNFERGDRREGGEFVNTFERDRVLALRLYQQAMPLVVADPERSAIASFFMSFALTLKGDDAPRGSWRLQALTDLAVTPDWVPGWNHGSQPQGAPVDAEGNPIFYKEVKTFDAAANDGERWRWAMQQGVEFYPQRLNEARFLFAAFLQQEFGVQTLLQYGIRLPMNDEADEATSKDNPYTLHTLTDDETIARLATGVKRFTLPDEFNYIKLYQKIADEPQTGHGDSALSNLASVYSDRRQFTKAAEVWKRCIATYGEGPNGSYKQQLQQITGNWGRFENCETFPAGKGPQLLYRFRNGQRVELEAFEIKVNDLIADLKKYLKSDPRQLDWNQTNIDNIGYRLVEQNEAKYVGAKAATWSLDLKPRAGYEDAEVSIATPLQKAGAYLVTAKMADGNVSRLVVWVNDTIIVKKRLANEVLYYVADAVTGAPVGKADVELFGYRQRYENNRVRITTTDFAERTDAQGQLFLTNKDLSHEYTWLAMARTDKGRFAFLGFSGVWYGGYHDPSLDQVKVFTITDCPVYRPKTPVKYKLWVARAKYDAGAKSEWAGRDVQVEIVNPKGDKVHEATIKADDFGGVAGEWAIPEDATLGQYSVHVPNLGGGSFRIEEYKKPEFQVTVEAPTEPIALGEKITAKIQAKYYFGSPVVEATVKYKVTRTAYQQRWYPICRWDWLYGRGYAWLGNDCFWYPGFNRWGHGKPFPMWFPRNQAQPEIVAELEVPIGPDGTVSVEIDTAVAKAIHADEDHRYEISAEVVDQSRRTIVGTGAVLVARQPFDVVVWSNRGYLRAGDAFTAQGSARTLNEKPVQGAAKLTLFKVDYAQDGTPTEKEVQSWDAKVGEAGEVSQQITAAEPGQYRLSLKVTDSANHTIEGGQVLTVLGEQAADNDFRFNDLELSTEKAEYAAGETAKLLIATDRPNSTVLLFPRPASGAYQRPKFVAMNGKTAMEDVAIGVGDMPNFFMEVLTIANGRVYTETKEIFVPPAKKVVNVEVQPSAPTYTPGQEGQVVVKVTDSTGEPFVGSTVVAMYDKSLEYISGGSNVESIAEFFWKWRRQHYPQTESSVARSSYNLTRSGETTMNDLGAFGHLLGLDKSLEGAKEMQTFGAVGGFGGGGGGMKDRMPMSRAAGRMLKLAAAEAAPAAPATALDASALGDAPAEEPNSGNADGNQGPAMVQPTIRKNFADAVLWVAAISTDKDGTATIPFKSPENLTTWKVKAWTMGPGVQVGQADAEVVTRKNLLVRMQAPRFFTQTDEVVLSANVHNYLDKAKLVEVKLELDGKVLTAIGDSTTKVEIPAGGEHRVDWRVKVAEEGQAVVRMLALTDQESDAVESSFPAYIHGMLKTESWSGLVKRDQASGTVTVRVPNERRIEQTKLEVRYSPTLAGAMVDALPYLANYPYGCTEQTLNRFLPTVVVQKTLLDMNLDLKAIQEKRTNLNAQEIGDAGDRAAQWKRYDRNPVFDDAEVKRMTRDGLKALTDMQLSDGGWGWFSGFGEHSSAHLTSLVVHGLQVAKQADLALVPDVYENGVKWLQRYQDDNVVRLKNAATKTKPWKEQCDDLDAFVFMVLTDAGVKNDAMKDFLYRDRVKLAAYSKAMFGLSLHKLGDQEKLAMILKNIEQFLVRDAENQTAYLKLPPDNMWWYWYGSEIEADAYYLKLLTKVDPKGPVAGELAKYLVNNRKNATYWNSTRDTAICIEAFADFLKASGESKPTLTVEVLVDGKKQKEVQITPETLFSFDNALILSGDALDAGEHKIEIKKTGDGPLYFNVYLTNFTMEDPITKTGLEIKVDRAYYKLTRVDAKEAVAGDRGQALEQKIEKYERTKLDNLSAVTSGDLIEVELEIDSKNDYEYLLFEDMKAAGFEPVDVRSGYVGKSLPAYMEVRDNRVCFFVRQLLRGKHSVAYRVRAEIPGRFSALPTVGEGMYAPELKANSDEIKLVIVDKPEVAKPAAGEQAKAE